MKARYLIDKDDNVYEMYQQDRTESNRMAVTEPAVLGKFVAMLSATLRMMTNGQTLIIECEKTEE